MARQCDICGRGSQKKVIRSHSNRATLTRQYPNLQKKTIDGKQIRVCTKCIRTMKKHATA